MRRYAKGAAVLREGDRATAAGVLLEGRLLVCRTDWNGRRTRDKVLAYLAAQSVRAGARDFEIPLSRQGLADYLAVDRSALSAELGRLRREGVLDFRKNRFRLR